MLRSWVQQGHNWVSVNGSIDSGHVFISGISNDDKIATVTYRSNGHGVSLDAPIGTGGLFSVTATQAKITVNNNVQNLSGHSPVYVTGLRRIAAIDPLNRIRTNNRRLRTYNGDSTLRRKYIGYSLNGCRGIYYIYYPYLCSIIRKNSIDIDIPKPTTV